MVELLAFRLDVGIYVVYLDASILLLEGLDVVSIFCMRQQTCPVQLL